MTTRLRTENINQLSRKVATPNYQRDQLTAGILHIGVGNFHRAHQALYLDDLFNIGEGHDWAIVGAGVRSTDALMRYKLMPQDLLTTIVEQDADYSAARVIGSMIDFIDPAEQSMLIARLADPAIRIVTLTISESGYYIDPVTGSFDPRHPDIVHDAANPGSPKTVFGMLLAGLALRKAAGIVPFTLMSCDSIPRNGVVTRNALTGLAALYGGSLDVWVTENVAIPNCMIDRITPKTTDRERILLRDEFGVEDNWPVFCESFKHWVIEDNFPAGRPPLEKVGVHFVRDVSPFELMKIRTLNGGQAAIAYPAALMDIEYVHEAMENTLIRGFLEKIEIDELIPCVPPVPDTKIEDYYKLIVHRLSNPKVADTIARQCLDGSNRQPKFIIPSIEDRLNAGKSVVGLALESALWCRYCYGVTDSGKPIAPNDPLQWNRLQTVAKTAKAYPTAWLGMFDIYGDLAKSGTFQADFTNALRGLWKNGTRATLRRYIAGDSLF
jgi:mannitol 2-dehydrogenase